MADHRTTVVIPNYNGIKYIADCLDSLLAGTVVPEIIVVDNASADGSFELVRDSYPQVRLLRLKVNTGFCHAVNSGLRLTRTEYVMLLNNDTRVEKDAVEKLAAGLMQRKKCFAVQARMLSMRDPSVLDDAGDEYCALGWAYPRGKAKPADSYPKAGEIFSACAGAAMYRREVFDRIGYFDERHYCYLEDIDISYRARIYGYYCCYLPDATVYHAGSASSGAVHNEFKERMAAGNNRYLLWKNMPAVQYGLNYPLFRLGEKVKQRYFDRRGLGDAWADGLTRGSYLIRRAKYISEERKADLPTKGTISEEAGTELFSSGPEKSAGDDPAAVHPLYLGEKVKFSPINLPNYVKIQLLLWKNIAGRFTN